MHNTTLTYRYEIAIVVFYLHLLFTPSLRKMQRFNVYFFFEICNPLYMYHSISQTLFIVWNTLNQNKIVNSNIFTVFKICKVIYIHVATIISSLYLRGWGQSIYFYILICSCDSSILRNMPTCISNVVYL